MLTTDGANLGVCEFVGGTGRSDWLKFTGRGFYALNERWFTHSINQVSDSSLYYLSLRMVCDCY